MFIPYLRHTLPDCSDTTTSLWICILITFLGHTPSPLHTLMFLFKMYFYHFSCTYSIRKSNLHILYLKMYFYPFSWHIQSPSLTKTFSCFFYPFPQAYFYWVLILRHTGQPLLGTSQLLGLLLGQSKLVPGWVILRSTWITQPLDWLYIYMNMYIRRFYIYFKG